MRPIAGVILFSAFLCSCLSEQEQRLARARAQMDKFDKEQFKDSLMDALETEDFNKGLALANEQGPVVVKKAVIVKRNGSRVIEATVKNRTAHKIDALILSWELRDAFDERVETINGGGTVEDILKPNATSTYYWDVGSRARKARAYVGQVHFKDSTTWKADKIK